LRVGVQFRGTWELFRNWVFYIVWNHRIWNALLLVRFYTYAAVHCVGMGIVWWLVAVWCFLRLCSHSTWASIICYSLIVASISIWRINLICGIGSRTALFVIFIALTWIRSRFNLQISQVDGNIGLVLLQLRLFINIFHLLFRLGLATDADTFMAVRKMDWLWSWYYLTHGRHWSIASDILLNT
jgi:hypothetical protein